MATFLLVCLIIADSLLVHSMAARHFQRVLEPKMPNSGDSLNFASVRNQELHQPQGLTNSHFRMLSFWVSLASSQSIQHKIYAEAPKSLEFSEKEGTVLSSGGVVTLGALNPTGEEHGKHNSKEVSRLHQAESTEEEYKGMYIAEAPGNLHKGKHHTNDKSIYGGGVILGGLATTFLVSIFCYIRVTRRRTGETQE